MPDEDGNVSQDVGFRLVEGLKGDRPDARFVIHTAYPTKRTWIAPASRNRRIHQQDR